MIYFIRSGGKEIKIGRTAYNDAKARMKNLQIGNPNQLELLGVMEGDFEIETHLHDRFGDWRIRGEWFHPTPSLIEYIRDNACAVGSLANRPRARNIASPSFWRKPIPSREILESLISSDPETGVRYWRERRPHMFSSAAVAKSWNIKHAGKPIGNFTVMLFREAYTRNEIEEAMNDMPTVVHMNGEQSQKDCSPHVDIR